ADLLGPGSRGHSLAGAERSFVNNMIDRATITPADFIGRSAAMMRDGFPRQIAARSIDAASMSASTPQGHDWLFWPAMLILSAVLIRAVQLTWRAYRSDHPLQGGFAWYLVGVGVASALGYIATRPAEGTVDRYMLLTVLIPVGVVALMLA